MGVLPRPPSPPPDLVSATALSPVEQSRLAELAGQAQRQGAFPQAAIDFLQQAGWGAAVLPPELGGRGLAGLDLLKLLRQVGRASLPLGRIYEGHLNALLLVQAFGDVGQVKRAAQDARLGRLFGVWNTEGPDALRLVHDGTELTLQGAKTFATGATHVTRPMLPAEGPGGRQLVLFRAEDCASQVVEVPGSWQPLGMESTLSVKLDFSGSRVQPADLIGAPGDYYRQPMFSTGALRFCAVQLGGADELLAQAGRYLRALGRAGDEVQQLRFAEAWKGLHGAWLTVAEGERLEAGHLRGKVSEARLLAQVDAARLATEDACLQLAESAERAVGARGLLEPEPFSRLIRDLRMYLRQPAPDAARLRLGRWVLEGAEEDGA